MSEALTVHTCHLPSARGKAHLPGEEDRGESAMKRILIPGVKLTCDKIPHLLRLQVILRALLVQSKFLKFKTFHEFKTI